MGKGSYLGRTIPRGGGGVPGCTLKYSPQRPEQPLGSGHRGTYGPRSCGKAGIPVRRRREGHRGKVCVVCAKMAAPWGYNKMAAPVRGNKMAVPLGGNKMAARWGYNKMAAGEW